MPCGFKQMFLRELASWNGETYPYLPQIVFEGHTSVEVVLRCRIYGIFYNFEEISKNEHVYSLDWGKCDTRSRELMHVGRLSRLFWQPATKSSSCDWLICLIKITCIGRNFPPFYGNPRCESLPVIGLLCHMWQFSSVDVIIYVLFSLFFEGTPVNRVPIMAKQTLDLFKLFKLVVEKGGLVEVSPVLECFFCWYYFHLCRLCMFTNDFHVHFPGH